jgi:hypothetical protein
MYMYLGLRNSRHVRYYASCCVLDVRDDDVKKGPSHCAAMCAEITSNGELVTCNILIGEESN